MIRIRAFRAPEDHNACEGFIAGHRKILEIYYGIIKITSDNTDWVSDPDSIVIVAEDPSTHFIYGGARLQIASCRRPLPIESAIKRYDPRVEDLVRHERLHGGTAEVCGLWNSKEVAGMGIGSHILSMVGVAVACRLKIKSIFVLCAPGTVRVSKAMGTKVVTSLGKEGTFYYPKDNFVATVMKLDDVNNLSTANAFVAEKINHLKHNPCCVCSEKGPKGAYTAEYRLQLNP